MGEAQTKKHGKLLHEVRIDVIINPLSGVEVKKKSENVG